MPPPTRDTDAAYHFHVYDYAGSGTPDKGPFAMSDGQPLRHGWRFYSLVQDLNGLYAAGDGIPGIELGVAGAVILPYAPPSEANRYTMVLSLGPRDAPAVVITGGMHAREWIAPEMAYLLAEYLVIHYTTTPQNRYQRAIRDLVNSRRIHIIPMLNPHGNHYTVFGQDPGGDPRMWRKNRRELPDTPAAWVAALTSQNPPHPNDPFHNVLPPPPSTRTRYDVPGYDPAHDIPPNTPDYQTGYVWNTATGVDLNRNCTTDAWGYDCVNPNGQRLSYSPAEETYFGPRASSEAETRNVEDFLAGTAVLVSAIDYHSYGKCIVYPSESFNTGAVGRDYEVLGMALQLLVGAQGRVGDYRLGSSLEVVHYEATGTISDHIAQNYHARAFTIELDPGAGDAAAFDLPETQIRDVFEKNIRGALAAIAAPRPAGADWSSALRRSAKISKATLRFLGWDVYGRGNRLPA
jgi:hypothetical protein